MKLGAIFLAIKICILTYKECLINTVVFKCFQFALPISWWLRSWLKSSGVVIRASYCCNRGWEFDSWLGKVHSVFHPFGINKMSTKLARKLNTKNPMLDWPLVPPPSKKKKQTMDGPYQPTFFMDYIATEFRCLEIY